MNTQIESLRNLQSEGNVNKAVAIGAKVIAYRPMLRELTGGVLSSILLQQLEYWSATSPKGFYKFLKPSPNHRMYKHGDSWTEELSFSEHEFRTAFDKIGIRYSSKKSYLNKIAINEDPFLGKFYLSIVDRKTGITTYLRNHKLVNEAIDTILTSIDENTSSQRNKIDKNQLDTNISLSADADSLCDKSRGQISRNADHQGALIYKETKNTTKNTTVAERAKHETKPSAAVENFEEYFIGNTLTEKQIEQVSVRVKEFSRDINDEEQLLICEAFKLTLVSPKSFSSAGKDFTKKLNTLCKVYREGKWNPLAEHLIQKNKKDERLINELLVKKNNIKQKINHDRRLLDASSSAEHGADMSVFLKAIENDQNELRRIEQEICQIKKNIGDIAGKRVVG